MINKASLVNAVDQVKSELDTNVLRCKSNTTEIIFF